MGYKIIKSIRVFVSLIFFILITFFFLDFTNTFASGFINTVLYLQFIPSLLKFLNLLCFSAIGFIIIIFLTLLFGRIYCSFFCPLGTLQDIINYISGKFNKMKKYSFYLPNNRLRYFFLILTIVVFLSGSIIFFNLLDPFSNFGKIISNLIRPVYYMLNNLTASIFEFFNLYILYPVEIRSYDILTLIFSFFFLGLVSWLAYTKGRLFCNTVCPVGTFLGLISKFSVFKIKFDKKQCINCEICIGACKANCIDIKRKEIDFSRCVGCFNCLNVCSKNGITYKFSLLNKNHKKQIKQPDTQRRTFLKKTISYSLGLSSLAGLAYGQNIKRNLIPIKKNNPVSPPGSKSIKHFTESCTACHLCISACPTQVLQPSFFEYGITGIMQPMMDFDLNFCNYECNICSQICPSGAILPIILEEKKKTQLGKAIFIKENCIVYNNETDCGACSEHCPTKAVDMVPYKNKLFIPEVYPDFCVGCGACEYVCPVAPKAIYVEGNIVHLEAKKPEVKKIQKKFENSEDFPF